MQKDKQKFYIITASVGSLLLVIIIIVILLVLPKPTKSTSTSDLPSENSRPNSLQAEEASDADIRNGRTGKAKTTRKNNPKQQPKDTVTETEVSHEEGKPENTSEVHDSNATQVDSTAGEVVEDSQAPLEIPLKENPSKSTKSQATKNIKSYYISRKKCYLNQLKAAFKVSPNDLSAEFKALKDDVIKVMEKDNEFKDSDPVIDGSTK